MRSSRLVRVAACFCSTLSSDNEIRANTPPRPPAVALSAMRVVVVASSRDCSRASRSGGATKITVSLMGRTRAGFSAGTIAAGAVRAGLMVPVVDGSPVSAVVRCSRSLPLKQCIEFFLELLLIEELATHDAVDLGAQFGNAILIGELHFRLPSHQSGQDIVTKSK